MNRRSFLRHTAIVAGLGVSLRVGAAETKPTNLVFILTDNHGAWTLGCYGNPDIRTPNLDRMAREGIRFTRSYSCNAVCSPTRATYLTGLIPSQHGVHKYIDPKVMLGAEAYATLEEFDTLPQVLSEAGYTCGLSGKWHLGDNMRPQEGFSFWVAMPSGSTSSFVDQQVIENDEMHTVAGHITDYWTKRGIEFIEANRNRPFFLFLAYNAPYGLGKSVLTPPTNRHAAYYADKDMASFPRETPHPWLHNNHQMINNVEAMRKYACEISGMDDGVGEVLAALKRLGLDENTLVVFTGDQGLAGGHSGFWGMGDHTRPLTAYDWTMHVPLILRHPGRIAPGQTTDALVSNYDFMPTVLDYLGLADRMPKRPESPGRSYAPILRGETIPSDRPLFYEFENVRAIRTETWKYIERYEGGPNELYNLVEDPGERNNFYGTPEHADTQNRLAKELTAFFQRYAVPKWDLWHGGDAKGGLLVMKKQPLP